jgi:hypothetical protein
MHYKLKRGEGLSAVIRRVALVVRKKRRRIFAACNGRAGLTPALAGETLMPDSLNECPPSRGLE